MFRHFGNSTGMRTRQVIPAASIAPRSFIYSTLLPRRNTITPKKTSAKTAHNKRINGVSILGSSFRSNSEGALHVDHHGDEIPHDAHQHRSYRHHEKRRQNTEKNRKDK